MLERLNVFARVKNLEQKEEELLDSVDTLRLKAISLEKSIMESEKALSHILDYMDRRSATLDTLNRKLLMFKTSEDNSLDMVPDLDLEVN